MDDETRRVSRRGGASAKRGGAALGDPQAERRTEEIEAEIQETREELSETIDAIQEKLRPANIVADATERIKTATTEKVKSMAETASDTAQSMMDGTRERASGIIQGARQNPVPALMIGAGVAWLLIDRTRHQGNGSRGRPYRGSSYDDSRSDFQSTPRAYAGSDDYYRSSSAEAYGSGSGYATGSPGGWSSKRYDAGAPSETRENLRRVQNQFQRLLHDNPLLVGAAAVLVGAAVGAALPETEPENELMGETRDQMVDRAQELARNAANSVQDVATDAIGEVADRTLSKNP